MVRPRGRVTGEPMTVDLATSPAAPTPSAATATRTVQADIHTDTMTTRYFEPGEDVVLRYITRFGSGVGMTWPFRVVHDDGDLTALYIPAGATFMRWQPTTQGGRELAEGEWRRDVLRLMFPGRQYSVWLFWSATEHEFANYYVNFEEPFRRTPVGFDTNDHALDIMVAPDFSWRWKDREEFETLVSGGQFSEEFGASVEDAARDAIGHIHARRVPFNGSWPKWSPPPDWSTPRLHPRWRDEPPVPWERRDWAYPLAAAAR